MIPRTPLKSLVCPACEGRGHDPEIEHPRCVNYISSVCKNCNGVGRVKVRASA